MTAVRMPQAGGRAWVVPADIDTDQLAPGATMKLGIEATAARCLAGLRPDFAAGVRPGDVLVAGADFGIGSSREQAVQVLRHLGIAAVVAPSFAGLYFRNACNLGLPALACADAGCIADGERLRIELRAQRVRRADGRALACAPMPDFLIELIEAGGLLAQLERRLAVPAAASKEPP